MLKIYATEAEVPEALRATAIKTADGKFVADEPPDPALGDAGKRALDAMKKERDDAEKARKAAEKERDDLKRNAEAAAKGITAEELQKIRDAEAAARKPIEDERDKLAAENRRLKLTDRVRVLGVKHGWMSDRVEKAMKDLDGRVDLTADGNGIVVKDAAGNVTSESIEDFLGKTYKAEASFFYAGNGASGSGADATTCTGGSDEAAKAAAAGKAAAATQKKAAEAGSLALK